jgi:TRAP-type transport system periplasmic protein
MPIHPLRPLAALCLAGAAVVALGISTGPTFAADVTLRLGHGLPTKHVYQFTAEYFAKRMAEETDGQVEVKIYPTAQLGNEKVLGDGLRQGNVDLAFISAANSSPFVPEFGFLSVGYMFDGFDHLQKVLKDDKFGAMMDELVAKRGTGFTRVSTLTSGVRNFYNIKRLISDPKDISGFKMRVMSSPIETKVWGERMGALPVAIPIGEVYTSMQTGLVHAYEGPLGTFYTGKMYEVAPYVALTEHQWALNFLFASDKVLAKLPDEVRAAILTVGGELTDFAGNWVVADDQKVLKILQDKFGVKVAKVDKAPFREAVAPMQDEVAKELGATAILERIRALQ